MSSCDGSDVKNGVKSLERNMANDVTVQIMGTCGKSITLTMANDKRTDDDILKEELEIYAKSGHSFDMIYGIEDNPPIHMCFLFGLQQVLLSISSTVSIPLIVCAKICADDLDLVKSEIMSTFLFMCGICTILQDTIGVRLPIIQGGCHKFIPAITSLMLLPVWKCPDFASVRAAAENTTFNVTFDMDAYRTEVWQSRMRVIQGGIILASLTQVVIGCTGILGVLIQFIGPITVVPTITLVGFSLVDVAMSFCQVHWGISALTVCLVFLFALYLRNVNVPFCGWSSDKRCHIVRYPVFKLLPVILAVLIAWGVAGILTATNTLSPDPKSVNYHARTDARTGAVSRASWFFFPYPCQWGLPTVSVASYMAMLAATLASIIESVGDYYACARISCAPAPPAHAINRGIAIEGFGSIISGLVGSGGATTSYSQNVGAIGFTKVASRRAFQAAGLIFLLGGLVGKFGAVLTMLPDPVLGGVILISFGMVTSVGLSTLQFVDLSSGRNLCIIGSSMLIGLMVPNYMARNPGCINTGISELDQVLTVLLSTAMFLGGIIGFVLDNTVPGTAEERGVLKWRETMHVQYNSGQPDSDGHSAIYDLPLIMPCLRRFKCFSHVPFLPLFHTSLTGTCLCKFCGKRKDKQKTYEGEEQADCNTQKSFQTQL